MQLIYEEGFDAGLVSMKPNRNPYPAGSFPHDAWQCGFFDANPQAERQYVNHLVNPIGLVPINIDKQH